MPSRVSRAERRERVRADLVAAARVVFLRRGFHAASLDEIAAEAGWTKGAVFSNFSGKDDLFLAVVEENNRHRRADQVARLRDGGSLAGGLRAAGRDLVEAIAREPGWTPLLIEFWTHAARHPAVRARASALHEDLLQEYAELIAELAARDGLEFVLPPLEVARGAASLARGLTIERLLDPASVSEARFEQLFSDHVLAHTRPVAAAPVPAGPRRRRSP